MHHRDSRLAEIRRQPDAPPFGDGLPGNTRHMWWPWLIVALSIVLSAALAVLISRRRVARRRR